MSDHVIISGDSLTTSPISWMSAPHPEYVSFCVSEKSIRTMSISPSGDRLITGGSDGSLRVFDLSSIRLPNPTPVKHFYPVEAHATTAVGFSSTGNFFLCAAGDSKLRVYPSDGGVKPIIETAKGDSYVRMSENTVGHTQSITSAQFIEGQSFVTGSLDGTLRVWDMEGKKVGMDQNITQNKVMKCLDARGVGGSAVGVYCLDWSCSVQTPALAIAGCCDGSIQLFEESKVFKHGKPFSAQRRAHDGAVVGIKILTGSLVASRGEDGFLRFWDHRKFVKIGIKQSERIGLIHELGGLPGVGSISVSNGHPMILIIGCENGKIIGVRVPDSSLVPPILFEVCIPTPSVTATLYHPILNQIIAATSDGHVYFFYDRSQSKGGALLFEKGGHQSIKQSNKVPTGPVYSVEELLASGDFRESKKGNIRQVEDPHWEKRQAEIRSLKGREDHMPLRTRYQEQDIQEALTRGVDNRSDQLFTNAYTDTQPKTLLDYTNESTPADELLRKRPVCPKCGLKICTCGYLRDLEEREAKRRRV